MTLGSLLSHWRSEPDIGGNIVSWRTLPVRLSQTTPFPKDLHPLLENALHRLGIKEFFSHQLESWQYYREGKNWAVVTGTASGKTLCYNLPVIDRLLRDPQARALYLFPTKALSRDQWVSLEELIGNMSPVDSMKSKSAFNLEIGVYDGDTSKNTRQHIRKQARLLITNPDMLHNGILPHHTSWAPFLEGLQFVIIDEMHIYRGVFGSNVANVLRRLRRVAAFYGAGPIFILTSATIGNPGELAERFVESPVSVIEVDGSARGRQHFLFYNPPVIDRDLGLRRSVLHESVRLVEDLLTYGLQTIIFARTRRTVELILSYLRDRINGLSWTDSLGEESIRGYRSGYLPEKRRQIERGMLDGEVRAVVATSALELGIDIGGMGAAVISGYPGSISGTWQQAGRAGRGEEDSLAVLLTSASPIDQFLARNPEYFFSRSVESALINPDNLLILLAHLRCAAFELPFRKNEGFGSIEADLLQEYLNLLLKDGTIYQSGEKYFWMADAYPAQEISLRSASSERVSLQIPIDGDAITIGEVDKASANWMVHPGAIYLHEAQTFHVDELDLDRLVAYLHPIVGDYYTEPRSETTVQLVEQLGIDEVYGGYKAHGEILVTTQVIGFRKVRWYTHENLGYGELDLPPSELLTTGYWVALSESTIQNLQLEGLWNNARNYYGPGWQKIRNQVRERDGFRCQVCGVIEGERAHDVHHKIPFRLFPSSEIANQLSNLITLCPSCHQRAELTVSVRSGLAGMAFALENLAPLFLMCDSRDLGVYSDPQSNFADGGPAIMLYDQIPAGIGFSERLFEIHYDLISSTRDLVATCECTDGCPSCVGPGGEFGQGGKRETLAILDALWNKS